MEYIHREHYPKLEYFAQIAINVFIKEQITEDEIGEIRSLHNDAGRMKSTFLSSAGSNSLS